MACTYRETTTVDELGKDGGVAGSELRLFEVEVKGTEVTRRELVTVTKSGAPLADLLELPRDPRASTASSSKTAQALGSGRW